MHGTGLLLIAAASGYWVLTLADKQKDRVRKLGYLLGGVIMLVSIVGVGCKLYYQWACGSGYSQYCAYHSKWGKSGKGGGVYCPLTQPAKPATPPASE